MPRRRAARSVARPRPRTPGTLSRPFSNSSAAGCSIATPTAVDRFRIAGERRLTRASRKLGERSAIRRRFPPWTSAGLCEAIRGAAGEDVPEAERPPDRVQTAGCGVPARRRATGRGEVRAPTSGPYRKPFLCRRAWGSPICADVGARRPLIAEPSTGHGGGAACTRSDRRQKPLRRLHRGPSRNARCRAHRRHAPPPWPTGSGQPLPPSARNNAGARSLVSTTLAASRPAAKGPLPAPATPRALGVGSAPSSHPLMDDFGSAADATDALSKPRERTAQRIGGANRRPGP